MNYTHVSTPVENILSKIDYNKVNVITYGLTQNSDESLDFRDKKTALKQILNIDEKTIPSLIDSIGHGHRLNENPYFQDVKEIINEVKNRVAKYGIENLIKINPLLLTASMNPEEIKNLFEMTKLELERTKEINKQLKGSHYSFNDILKNIKEIRPSNESNNQIKPL